MNRNAEVDRWPDEAAHPQDATMRRARENIASFNPSKHLVSIMFHRGAEIPGEHPRLKATASSSGRCASPAWTSSRPGVRSWRR
jgi:hypothetical protein